ncbi:hypothetical protein PUN28_008307 [Cardiocondyla obscurior]|uniref:Secreted protein n=1 Tax=Cardiocondyla obscurior TaxID=286306 RepID=A0AAW2FZ04_9HYME
MHNPILVASIVILWDIMAGGLNKKKETGALSMRWLYLRATDCSGPLQVQGSDPVDTSFVVCILISGINLLETQLRDARVFYHSK